MGDLIAEDADRSPGFDNHVVLLGDYVDRGPDSQGVIDRLCTGFLAGFRMIHLRGNHEDAMIRFLDEGALGPQWMRFGGMATLASYDIERPSRGSPEERLDVLRDRVARALPERHAAFLRGLTRYALLGGYLFVHAGIRPGVALDHQRDRDLYWIRDGFLDSDADFGVTVVHGHTIVREPAVRPNRIGIDTGAFNSGRLTCLVLEGLGQRFLATR
jgi:serine/threonine protein phosphatase 1